MKNSKKLFIIILILLNLNIGATTIFAIGEGNIDSGGGGMGNGTSMNVWSYGNEGVRVTVVRASDHAVVTAPIDLTNKKPNNIKMHFNKLSKIQYKNGSKLLPQTNKYKYVNPSQSIPRIISKTGNNNIKAIKSYFTDEQIIRSIASLTGMNFDVMVGGDYKLLIEPIAYYKFQGVMIATTATEAAMYDEKLEGLMRKKMPSLTHKNLPLAMFLEVGDLGYPAWSGSTTKPVTDAEIKSSLGLGIVRFKNKLPETPIVSSYDYEYRTNTEVITAVTVSGGQSDPSNQTNVDFNIAGTNYNVSNIYYPDGGSQIAWVKWQTPSTEQDMTIYVSMEGPGNIDKSIINVKIVDLDKNTPPNPTADDRNDSFSRASIPNRAEKTRAEWTVWKPWWKENWVDRGHWEKDRWIDKYGKLHIDDYWVANWIDEGWYEFDLNHFYAVLSADMNITNDSKNPTASGRTMKSGYGINESITASISSNKSDATTYPQTAISYFPEFRYENYWRVLERVQGGSYPRFEFQKNEYSTYKSRTHFTPIWMPDGYYAVNTWLIDAWTPDGMLSINLTDSLNIEGNLWQDWHIAPLKP